MEQPKYVLALASDVKTHATHFKLERDEHIEVDMVSFSIMSGWYGSKLEAPEKILVVVKAEEFESVKNFLLTIRDNPS